MEKPLSRFAPLAPLAAVVALSACGEVETPEPDEPIPPPPVVYCGPEITCAGPLRSNEAGFATLKVGVRLQNNGCWDQEAGKSVWLGASPVNRRIVTDEGRVEPNVSPDLLLPADDTTVMPVTPGRAENREKIRRVLTVARGDGNGALVALQVNDVRVDAAARNHARRLQHRHAPETIPVRTCFGCLTEDQRTCGEMDEATYDACVANHDPSLEYEVTQVSDPTALPTDTPPCEEEDASAENGPQASVREAVEGLLAEFRRRGEENARFRRFVEKRLA